MATPPLNRLSVEDSGTVTGGAALSDRGPPSSRDLPGDVVAAPPPNIPAARTGLTPTMAGVLGRGCAGPTRHAPGGRASSLHAQSRSGVQTPATRPDPGGRHSLPTWRVRGARFLPHEEAGGAFLVRPCLGLPTT